MANKTAQKSCLAGAASTGSSLNKKGFSLNAHKVAIIVGLISLSGVLAASVLTSGGSVAVAVISNWDKVRGGQATQAVPDATGDLLAYNKQRRTLVESSFDEALGHLQEAEERATGPEAATIKVSAASIRAKKAVVQQQYDKVLEAIKDKKPVQAEINKTDLNTTIVQAQSVYDDLRVSLERINMSEDLEGLKRVSKNLEGLKRMSKNLESESTSPKTIENVSPKTNDSPASTAPPWKPSTKPKTTLPPVEFRTGEKPRQRPVARPKDIW